MKDFRGLRVWQKAHQLTLAVYKLTKGFQKEETYGFTTQIRRSSASVAAYIAEGCRRKTDRELCQFLVIAMGSATELEYHLLLARDLDYLNATDNESLQSQLTEVKKILKAFIQKLIANCQGLG